MDAPAVEALTDAPPARPDADPEVVPAEDGPEGGALGDEGAQLEHLSGRWRLAVAIGVSLAVAAGVVLRFWVRSPLWLDEALTVDIARLPLHDLQAALKRDGAPPLYYVLLHLWMGVFGTSDLGTRSLSGVIGVATLPVAWVAGRRYGGRTVAWIVLLLVATAPFAVYYATEARMYSLVMLLTACGFVAVDRALQRPRPGNLVAVAVVSGALLYTQYWSIYLLGSLAILLVWRSWHGERQRQVNARWTLGAVAAGCLTFVPWLPTFVFQARYTGTPWAKPPNFAAVINAVTGFTDNQATTSVAGTNQGRLLALCYFILAGLALFGAARDRWHVDLDLHTQRRARGVSFVVAATLFIAVTGGILTGSAFSPRYAAVVFIPLMLLVGLGTLTLADARVRTGLLAVAAVAGLFACGQNVTTQRTQAAQVAAVINARAQPGDIIAFCPDQLGPSVSRLVEHPGDYTMTTFPRGTGPEFVDWVNYAEAVGAASPQRFAATLERQAGSSHHIWLVWMPGYQSYGTRCEQLATALLQAPGYGGHNWVVNHPEEYYEPMNLTEFAPPHVSVGRSGPAGSRATPAPTASP